ncbi:hypothetical protein [Streptomyces scopuliridis]|uniref:hypothetical protein n=1 Tax=Streptomyces scopuliridis TaxID=452529 RepID=UPI0036A22240
MGAYAGTLPDGALKLFGQVTSLDGQQRVSGALTGPSDEPEKLGAAMAAALAGFRPLLDQRGAHRVTVVRGQARGTRRTSRAHRRAVRTRLIRAAASGPTAHRRSTHPGKSPGAVAGTG